MRGVLYILLLATVALACDNCAKCENEKCMKCNAGYILIGEKCVEGNSILSDCEEYNTEGFGCKRCVEGYTPTISGLCFKCEHVFGPDCLTCNPTSSETCTKCRDGAILTREGACIFCNKYFRQCSECDGNAMRCTKCTNGRKPDNGFC
ncbi:hypothetical protein EIN_468230 [Entamoeba invadens IP1]|uniref:High cysteine membrane protein group 2 n=1 Tax=Entamoeba invadens IP1 TaxID=370355 RepID=A0A0A1TUI6_ENTIV|nr:hypothetical protein EIN_468230 [Entamoeba invadens IP1]ELP83689.1 hypothetical protein EIN_468230 [Entamoeba invadens IP1]|eukprot:XP_004183035.1 hypothetical protein EIN_468230 [Entamoeba invadens IP1]